MELILFKMNFRNRFLGKSYGGCLSWGDKTMQGSKSAEILSERIYFLQFFLTDFALRRTKVEERCPIPYRLQWAASSQRRPPVLGMSYCCFRCYWPSKSAGYCCWSSKEDFLGGAIFAPQTIWDALPLPASEKQLADCNELRAYYWRRRRAAWRAQYINIYCVDFVHARNVLDRHWPFRCWKNIATRWNQIYARNRSLYKYNLGIFRILWAYNLLVFISASLTAIMKIVTSFEHLCVN